MANQSHQQSYALYGSDINIASAVILGSLMFGIIWSAGKLIDAYPKGVLSSWEWALIVWLPLLILIFSYVFYYEFRNDAVIVFNEQGIMIHRLGFVSWQDIQTITIQTTSGIRAKRNLQINLTPQSHWQPAPRKFRELLLVRPHFDAQTRSITINMHYLKRGPLKIADIYERLMQCVPRLREINHAGLYEGSSVATDQQMNEFPIYVSKKMVRFEMFMFGLSLIVLIAGGISSFVALYTKLSSSLSIAVWCGGVVVGLGLIALLWAQCRDQILLFHLNEPAFILNEQGITIHVLGFIAWDQIQKVTFDITTGRHRRSHFLIDLRQDSVWQPQEHKIFSNFTFYPKKKQILIDCTQFAITRNRLLDIYEHLMKTVPRLHEIDHSKLYE